VVAAVACAVACVTCEAAPAARKGGKGDGRPPLLQQSKRRIAEIAEWLPAKPAAPGARITDRAAWEKLAELDSAKRILRKAESILKLPVPECPDNLYLEYSKTGFRTDYEIPYNQRISNAQTLAAAECLENKERFLPKLTEYLEAICAERSWTYPAHDRGLRTFEGKEFNVDLGASARAWGCAWIVSVLKGSMSELLARKVKGELERRVFSTYRDCAARKTGNFRPLGWFNGPANWTAVCHSGVVRAALAVVEDRMDRAMFVETAERMLPFYIAGFPDDGYCSEGMGYWDYGWGHYLTLALAVKDATGGRVNFFKDPKTKTIMEFGTGCQMEEGHAPDFADGGGSVSDYVLLLGQREWPYLTVTTSAMEHDLLYGGSSVFTLRAFGQLDGIPERRVNPLPMRNAFPYGQVWVFRPDPKNAATPFTVGVKGGHNAEFHNHNDVGSYAIRFGGVLVSGDPGGTEYTALTFSPKRYTIPIISSYGHPVPVINGCYQEHGREYAARILSTEVSNSTDRVVMDIAAAYPKAAKVKNVIRTFTYERDARAFTVSDLVRFKVKGRASEPILTFGFVEPDGKEGEYRLRASAGGQVRDCKLSIAVDGANWKLSEGKRIDNPNRSAPMRYAILVDGEVTEVRFTLRFSADEEVVGRAIAAEAPPPDAAENELETKEGPVLFDEEAGKKAKIVYSTLEERVLARELQWYLGEMAEETFRLADKLPEDGPAVVIKVDEGEGRVSVQKDRVCISGHGKGLSKAATHFLEELGVRFLFPGENGLVIPGKPKIMYPDAEWREPPHAPEDEPPPLDRRQLIQLLKSPTPVKRDFYAWHGVDKDKMPPLTPDGWDIYRAAKGVDAADAKASEELLVDFRRAAYGPVARTMGEYFAEKAKEKPDAEKIAKILERALIDSAHEPPISARIRAIADGMR
jgi:hypothetical protein